MGLITRCPACGTMFKVVADQLRISEGWVRCGHCAEIFDAAADLHDEASLEADAVPPTEAADEPAPVAMPAATSGPVAAPVAAPVPSPVAAAIPAQVAAPVSDDPTVGSEFPSSLHSEVADSELEAYPPDPHEIEEQVHALREHPLDRPFELRRADTSDLDEVGVHGFSKPMPLEPEREREGAREGDADPELHDLSFVRDARRREFWSQPGTRVALVLLVVILAALLAGQVAWRERDRLAASSPGLRPWLAGACDLLRCRIGPPHTIDAVAIETSSFNKLRGDTYRLNVTLKNASALPVAMPALELTLTDSQDQPVLRRVVRAQEFAPATPAIGPGSDWSTSVAIAVNAQAAGGRVAGYRVLAFYP